MSEHAVSNAPAVLKLAASVVDDKADAIFSTWYDNRGRRDTEYTYNQMWAEVSHAALTVTSLMPCTMLHSSIA
jgi:hypothetical protein